MASASSYRHEVYHNMSGNKIIMGVKDIWQQYGTGERETDTLLEQDVVLAEAVGLLGTCQGRGQVNYNWSDIPPV